MLRADSVWVSLSAMYLNGASYAFRSGATRAFLYDTLAEQERQAGFAGLLGKALSASYLAAATTTWIGAALAVVHFGWPYGLAIAAGLAAAWLASGLREPPRDRLARRGLAQTVCDALAIVRGKPGLARLLAFSATLFTLVALTGRYAQAVLTEHGMPPSRVGLILGSTLLCTAFGSWFADRLGARFGFPRWTGITTLAIVATALGMGSGAVLCRSRSTCSPNSPPAPSNRCWRSGSTMGCRQRSGPPSFPSRGCSFRQ